MGSRAAKGVALGLVALLASGCSAARGIADGLADDGPRPTAGGEYAPGTSGPLPAPVQAVDLADAAIGRDRGAASGGTSSVYVVSPALTWGELQFHRPHAITGDLYRSYQRSPHCSAESWTPFEVSAEPNRPWAQDVVRAAHVPFGVRSSFLSLGPALTFDREVMADHVMRSGAYLVQRGPVCFGTFLEFSLFRAIGGDDGASSDVTYW